MRRRFDRSRVRGLALALAASCGIGAFVRAEEAERTRPVVTGPQYGRGSVHQLFFGRDYRRLWTTPAVFPVLDFAKEAGGLQVVRRIGGQQTKGLALKGQDGRNYTFRGIEKDASHILEAELLGTVVEKLLQDQMAAQHPASEVIARGLLEAASVPCPAWRMVVLPDDPALGAFRKEFAGAIGAFGEYPSVKSASNPGFRGATEIIDHLEMYKRLLAGRGDAIDVRGLLKARLVDIFMGDWDRHRKQWRWARFPGSALWQPIPEDRDQAFSRYEGLALEIGRRRDPRFQNFNARYGGIGGLTFNGWEQDRFLLSGLSSDEFSRTAEAVRSELTDERIEQAVRAMPRKWFEIDGPRLIADLVARRDGLPEIASKLYRHLAERVDVYMTDQAEMVTARRHANGDLDVSISMASPDGQVEEPYFERVFHENETSEVRFYAQGGDDKVSVSGVGGGIRVRMIGGDGNDTLDATGAGNAKLSDSRGRNRALAAGHDDRSYVPPPPPRNAPWIPPRDWSHETWTIPWVGYGADLGLFLGAGVETVRYGFRRHPHASHHVLRAGYSFGEEGFKVDYVGEFRRENRGSTFGVRAYASAAETLRFHGLGNETRADGPRDYYRASADQVLVHPTFAVPMGRRASFTVGPLLKYTRNDEDADELVNAVRPYGHGRFGELGLHGALLVDGRDQPMFPRRGIFLAARGTLFPKAWDVRETFGEANGSVTAYLSGGKRATLALRGGGKKVFGDHPYFEAASIGGGGLGVPALEEPDFTVRGFHSRRFLGDASLYGSADLRLRLSALTLVLPGHFGVFGFVDSGRVWLKGEDSGTWHTGAGGGIWYSILNDRSVFSAGVAHSKEDDLFYFKGGFTF
jgi:hypothetical protein